jgi:hypothetical protein
MIDRYISTHELDPRYATASLELTLEHSKLNSCEIEAASSRIILYDHLRAELIRSCTCRSKQQTLLKMNEGRRQKYVIDMATKASAALQVVQQSTALYSSSVVQYHVLCRAPTRSASTSTDSR